MIAKYIPNTKENCKNELYNFIMNYIKNNKLEQFIKNGPEKIIKKAELENKKMMVSIAEKNKLTSKQKSDNDRIKKILMSKL